VTGEIIVYNKASNFPIAGGFTVIRIQYKKKIREVTNINRSAVQTRL